MELQTLQEALKVEIQVHQVFYILSCFIFLSNSNISICILIQLMALIGNTVTTMMVIVLLA